MRPDAPLLREFPALAALPRADLGVMETPVERLSVDGREIWVKRDDGSAPVSGGNKVRALEFLLGGLAAGDRVVTLGGDGSTHVLSTALHAERLGLRTTAVRWPHEMSALALETMRRAAAHCERVVRARTAVDGILRARWLAWRDHARHIPIGGSTPLGVLGHVNGAMELASQVQRGLLPSPARVIVPLGSGGTAAGLALGFAMAGLSTRVVAARVAPRIFANRWRAARLATRTARLIERLTTSTPATPLAIEVSHQYYGGSYGRVLPRATELRQRISAMSTLPLDDTYSAKAIVCALDLASSPGPTLFWATFGPATDRETQ